MTLRSAFITLATVAGIVCFAGQDPRLDYSFAAPKLDGTDSWVQTTKPAQTAPARVTQASSKTVTISFRNAPVSDVLNWLQKQGVSFVIDESVVRNKRVSLNMSGQPLNGVVDSIASALDGHWTRRGSIYIYKPGSVAFFEGSTFSVPAIGSEMPKGFIAPKMNFEEFKFKDLKSLEGENMKGLKDLHIDVQKLKELEKTSPRVFAYGFDGPANKELAEKISAEVQNALKDSKVDDPAFWEKFSKELSDSLNRNLKGRSMFRAPTGQGFRFDSDKSEDLKDVRIFAEGNGVAVRSLDVEKFIGSMTPAQKDLMKSQGYLKKTDLTAEQRELLGLKDGANIDLTFIVKGEKVVIRDR